MYPDLSVAKLVNCTKPLPASRVFGDANLAPKPLRNRDAIMRICVYRHSHFLVSHIIFSQTRVSMEVCLLPQPPHSRMLHHTVSHCGTLLSTDFCMVNEHDGLKSLDKSGKAPECRMDNAAACRDWVVKLKSNDSSRAFKRGKVFGLVAGFPPYLTSKLKDAGRANATNANFLTSNAYMDGGAGALYDLFSEAPGMVGVKTDFGKSDEERDDYSQKISEEVDRILWRDELFDFEMQVSGWQTTLYGCGPLVFFTPTEVVPHAVGSGDLKVPERTRADTGYYDACTVDLEWFPPELFKYIRDEKAAKDAGWNVPYVKKVLQQSLESTTQKQEHQNWEWVAQQMKNNSVAYEDSHLIIRVAYVWWKEFDGKVTSAIIEANDNGGEPQYLFRKVSGYDSFKNAIHAMYYDRGHGGFHHSVNGLGLKMYSAMDLENKGLCNLWDKVKAPTLWFKPMNAEASQEFELRQHSDYAILPANYEAIQNPMHGWISEGLAMFRTNSELLRSNLSSYRQPVRPDLPGNPATALQVSVETSQQASLSKTTFSRYYRQLDALYTEIVRRLCIPSSPDARAKEFQKRCEARGVPKEALQKIDRVEAMRVIGQGSAFLRQQAVNAMMPLVGSLPESGKQKWLNCYIAAHAGQAAVSMWNPKQSARSAMEQEVIAALQVAAMKDSVPPVITENQNPIIFAQTFLKACFDAIQSLQAGAKPADVVTFIDLAAPAAGVHIQRAMIDPLRKADAMQLAKQLEQLSKVMDQIKGQMQADAEQQQQLAEQRNQVITDHDVKMAKVKSEAAIKEMKANVDADLKTQKAAQQMTMAQQQMAIADAQSASAIARENARQQAELQRMANEPKKESTK